MLAFITTLRHPQNAANYDRVEALLQDTLASLTQQTCDDYLVIIVGNRRPAFPLPERVVFVEVDFPPPSDLKGPRTGPASVIWDKGTKNAVGLLAARDFGPEYVMFVDADDFVHRELAAFVHARPGHAGWVVKRGLMYSRRRNAYKRLRNFYRFCGTSFIIPFDAYDVPAQLTVSATQQEIAAAFGSDSNTCWNTGGPSTGGETTGAFSSRCRSRAPSTRSRTARTIPTMRFSVRPGRTALICSATSPFTLEVAGLDAVGFLRACRTQAGPQASAAGVDATKSYLQDYRPPGDSVVPSP